MATSTTDSRRIVTDTRSTNRLLSWVFGATYLLVGLLGFAVTGGVGFAARGGGSLLGFHVNPLHNLVHVGVGAGLLAAAAAGARAARGANIAVGTVYLAVGVIGLFALDTELNVLAVNHPDNLLHLASAAALLGVGLGTDRG